MAQAAASRGHQGLRGQGSLIMCPCCLFGLCDIAISMGMSSLALLQRVAASWALVIAAAGGMVAGTAGATAATVQAAPATAVANVADAAAQVATAATTTDVVGTAMAMVPAEMASAVTPVASRVAGAVDVARSEAEVTAAGVTNWATNTITARAAAVPTTLPPL